MSISVALIAWYFPPVGGAGAQRPLHFARGLSSSGVSVRVLTPARHHESMWAPEDQDLAADSKGIDVRYLGIDQHDRSSGPAGSFEKAVLANLNVSKLLYGQMPQVLMLYSSLCLVIILLQK